MPKKLVGGVFLLCLTAMTLTLSEDGETFTNITQPEILEQLTNLKTYVSNPKMIKPVWVQLKNGDEIVVVQGELKVVDTGEFEIIVAINGYKLLIHIEFTQALNEDNEPIDDWYIDTNDAKYLFTSDAQNIGAIIQTGEIENAKPIYCHPVYLKYNRTFDNALIEITMLIFNNDNNAFTKQSFINWVKELFENNASAKILTSGYFSQKPVCCLKKGISPDYQFSLVRANTDTDSSDNNIDYSDILAETTTFEDGVNKIN